MLILFDCIHTYVLSKARSHFREYAQTLNEKSIRNRWRSMSGANVLSKRRGELKMEPLIKKQEKGKRQEENMDYNSGDDIVVREDVELVVTKDVKRESGSKEEGSRGAVWRNDSEKNSEEDSKKM